VLARSAVRNARGVGGLLGNNFIAVIVVLMAQEPLNRPSSTAFFYFVIGLLYAVPLARDLTLRIPADRFALWPLGRAQRALIHAANLALNPLLLVAVVFGALSRHPAVRAGLLVSGLIAPFVAAALEYLARVTHRFERVSIVRLIPSFPGRLSGLIQNHIREQLRMLDVYFAAAFSIGGLIYRFSDAHADAMAGLVIGHLLIIQMSTLAQAHLAYDGGAERTRARLLPISGPAILLAKDVAWLSIVAVLAAAYASPSVVAAACAALAVGHAQVARPRIEQRRGHFASGTLWPCGIVQILAIIVAGGTTAHFGAVVALLFAGAWAASLIWYGQKWEQTCAG
jgi:hypothetical protein